MINNEREVVTATLQAQVRPQLLPHAFLESLACFRSSMLTQNVMTTLVIQCPFSHNIRFLVTTCLLRIPYKIKVCGLFAFCTLKMSFLLPCLKKYIFLHDLYLNVIWHVSFLFQISHIIFKQLTSLFIVISQRVCE